MSIEHANFERYVMKLEKQGRPPSKHWMPAKRRRATNVHLTWLKWGDCIPTFLIVHVGKQHAVQMGVDRFGQI